MNLNKALREIMKIAEETGSEISISGDDGFDWYWKNLRFQPDEDEVPKLLEAIRIMKSIGFDEQ